MSQKKYTNELFHHNISLWEEATLKNMGKCLRQPKHTRQHEWSATMTKIRNFPWISRQGDLQIGLTWHLFRSFRRHHMPTNAPRAQSLDQSPARRSRRASAVCRAAGFGRDVALTTNKHHQPHTKVKISHWAHVAPKDLRGAALTPGNNSSCHSMLVPHQLPFVGTNKTYQHDICIK